MARTPRVELEDRIDGCAALEALPAERLVLSELDLLELVLTASIIDRSDRPAIEARLAEFRRLFDV